MDDQLVDPEGYPAARQLQAQQVGEPTEQACQRFSQIGFGNLKGEVKNPSKYDQKHRDRQIAIQKEAIRQYGLAAKDPPRVSLCVLFLAKLRFHGVFLLLPFQK